METTKAFEAWYRMIKENELVAIDTPVKSPEISNDVDTIITSLETLAKELTEEQEIITRGINDILSEEYVTINEAEKDGFLANIMKAVKSMKTYSVLKSAYPQLKQYIVDAEVEKVSKLGEFDMNSDEIKAQQLEKTKEKFKEALQKVSDADYPAAKKKAMKEKIRAMRDEAIKDGSSKSAAKKVEASKKNLQLKLDAAIRDAKQDLSSAEAENKIESETLSARWEKEKLEINDKFDIILNNSLADAEMEFYDDNPEAQERIMAKAKKAIDAAKKENAEKRAELEADLQELEAEQEELANQGDEKQKEANAKIKEFYKSGREYIAILNSTPDSLKNLTEEEKKEFIDKRKAYNTAKESISITTFKNSDPGLSEDDAEEMFTTFTDMIKKQVDEHKLKASTIKDKKETTTNKEGETETTTNKEGETETTTNKEGETETTTNKEGETETTGKNSKEGKLKRLEDMLAKAKESGDEEKIKKTQDLIDKVSAKESWQLGNTTLGMMLESEITKLEMSFTLNESRYQNLSVKERFSRLM
jgi:hypothetical protein